MNIAPTNAERSRRFQVGGMVAIAFAAGSLAHHADAAAVVVNPSFDVTDPTGFPVTLFAGDYTRGMGDTFLNPYRNNPPVNVPGWTSTTQNFLAGVENSGAFINPNDRATAYLSGDQAGLRGEFSQILAGATDPGAYILSVDVARRSDREFSTFTMELRDAATGLAFTPLTSDNPTPDAGAVVRWTQTYVIPASPNSLEIRFVSTGTQNGTNLDNVSLIPEPSTCAMFALGASLLGLRARKRKD